MKKHLLLLCLIGCIPTNIIETKQEVQSVEYYQDARTNLCFVRNIVTNSQGFSDNVFTYVPCTPEVEKVIADQEAAAKRNKANK